MFIDLDGFKQVNDSFGHQTGDMLLCEVAARLRLCVRGHDMVARLGGDEFVILCTDLDHGSTLHRVADRVLTQLALPYDLPGAHINWITASIGRTQLHQADKAEDVIHRADQAMYAAKRGGKNQITAASGPTSGTAARTADPLLSA